MAYVNLPPNLQDMFYSLSDRISKLETGPSQAMYTANSAQTDASAALADAAVAYALAGTSLQKDANTITNSTNNMTAINTSGVTVYSGASMSSGSRVIMNSAGIAGYDSSGNATFSILASTGAASFKGAITGSTITGSTLNISGNFIVNSSGNMTATGVDVTGTITSSAGTIGGWSIGSTGLYTGSISSPNNFLSNSGGALFTGTTTCSAFQVNSTTLMSGNLTVSAYIYNSGHPTTTSTANAFLNSSTGLLARSTSSQRYKVEIEPQEIPLNSVLALQPKSYVDKADAEAKGTPNGLPRYLGLIAEDVVQIPVLGDLLTNKDDEGRPDSVNYDRIAVALIPILKEHEARLNKLEGK